MKSNEISALTERFANKAKPFVEKIVEEIHLPLAQKTIRPISLGGIAGGEKFLVNNCFIKFCSSQHHNDLYGGAHFAQKAAKHELRSLNALIGCQVSSLHFPLVCLFNVKGYRIVVVSKLPISHDTLVYGSADAGQTIKTDRAVVPLLKKASEKLNLKPHMVEELGPRREKKLIYGPVDLEVHKGKDGRVYACDTARLFPPTLPLNGVPGSHLYKLFRPEFVAENPTPLSSDSFSRFGLENADLYNDDTKKAFIRLLKVKIPALAKEIDRSKKLIRRVNCRRPTLTSESWLWDMDTVKPVLHEAGCNLRFCGYILCCLKDSDAKLVLVMEMTARCIKNEVFEVMRKVNDGKGHVQAVESFLNTVFGKSSRQTFWKEEMLKLISRYFEFCRVPKYNCETVISETCQPLIDEVLADPYRVMQILVRVCKMSGLELRDVTKANIESDSPFQDTIKCIKTQITMMKYTGTSFNQYTFEESELFYLNGIEECVQRRGENDIQTIKYMLNLAILYMGCKRQREEDATRWFEKALKSASELKGQNSLLFCEIEERYVIHLFDEDPKSALNHIANIIKIKRKIGGLETELACALEIASSLETLFMNYDKATDYIEEAIALMKSHANEYEVACSEIIKAWLLFLENRNEEAQILYERGVEILKNHTDIRKSHYACALDGMAQNLAVMGRFDESDDAFVEAMKFKEDAFGTHVSCAYTYDHFAGACLLRGRLKEADQYSSKALNMISLICGVMAFPRGLCLLNRTYVLLALGDRQIEAEECAKEALSLLQMQLPAKHEALERVLSLLHGFQEDGNAIEHSVENQVPWVSHLELFGWSHHHNGLSCNAATMSEELLELLHKAGVTAEDLKNVENVEVIFTTLLEALREVGSVVKAICPKSPFHTLEELAKDARKNISICTRWHRLYRYRRCFVAKELVDWIAKATQSSRAQASQIGQMMCDRRMITHVADKDKKFMDAYLFFRFEEDEKAEVSPRLDVSDEAKEDREEDEETIMDQFVDVIPVKPASMPLPKLPRSPTPRSPMTRSHSENVSPFISPRDEGRLNSLLSANPSNLLEKREILKDILSRDRLENEKIVALLREKIKTVGLKEMIVSSYL